MEKQDFDKAQERAAGTGGFAKAHEEARRKAEAARADGSGEQKLMAIRGATVREELKQQMTYHCQEIRRILDMLDNTPHAVLESLASDMHRLVKAING